EDGMKAVLIKKEALKEVTVYEQTYKKIQADKMPDSIIRRTRTAKAIMDCLISDCIETSRKVIANSDIKSVEDIYKKSENLICLSKEKETSLARLEDFLLNNFYLHDELQKNAAKIKNWLGDLFKILCEKPELMPKYYQLMMDQSGIQRTVCDYISGMTDRFCLNTLEKFRTLT
ncbi:MAG: hypothetical protein PHF37_10455, partial [Phycisphaerae bacterium]|nr:hypothetical protein [Phycisphaerae bacterium]